MRFATAPGRCRWRRGHAFVENAARTSKLEAEVASQALDIQDTSRRLSDAKAQLEHAHELRQQFVLALSHDLRTPLSAATMGSQLINLRAQDAHDVRRISARVRTNLERINHMLRELLDASRINAGGAIKMSIDECVLRESAGSVIDDR